MKWSRMSLRIENNNNANDDVGWQHKSPQAIVLVNTTDHV